MDGQTIANAVVAPVSVSVSGEVCFYVYGTAHLIADVSGYFPTGSPPRPPTTTTTPGSTTSTTTTTTPTTTTPTTTSTTTTTTSTTTTTTTTATSVVVPDWWDTQWGYRTSVEVGAGGIDRSDALARVDVDFTATLASLGVNGTFDTSSLRVVEVDGSGVPIDALVAFQFDPAGGFDATANASGTLWILLGGQTAAGQTRSFDVYFDTVGKGFTAASVAPRIVLADGVVRQGLDTVRVSNGSGTFFYDKDGGGFSSLLDADGNDWISWSSASGASGEFRGVPNLVFPGGLMHPGLGGVRTSIVDSGPLVATLRSTSLDGQWITEWRIGPEHAELTVVEAPREYWFLYEGTPGGSLNTTTDTVIRPDGTVTSAGTAWTGDLPGDEWVAFGDPGVGRSLYVANHQPDQAVDSYRAMDGVMTVFGFGRQNTNSYLSGVDRSFSFGLTEGTGVSRSAHERWTRSGRPRLRSPAPGARSGPSSARTPELSDVRRPDGHRRVRTHPDSDPRHVRARVFVDRWSFPSRFPQGCSWCACRLGCDSGGLVLFRSW